MLDNGTSEEEVDSRPSDGSTSDSGEVSGGEQPNRPWTRREMEEAEPLPVPEISEDDDGEEDQGD